MYDVEKMKNDLSNKLSLYRYNHSLNVADTACKLASIYHVNEEDAYVAGLLHDIAKEFSDDENKSMINKYDLNGKIDGLNNKTIHGIIGAYYVKDKYNVSDDISNSIMFHTTGNVNMSLLNKIIFVADKIEPNKNYPGIDEERELAYKDITKAMILCMENNIKKLESEHKDINDVSREVLLKLKSEI